MMEERGNVEEGERAEERHGGNLTHITWKGACWLCFWTDFTFFSLSRKKKKKKLQTNMKNLYPGLSSDSISNPPDLCGILRGSKSKME